MGPLGLMQGGLEVDEFESVYTVTQRLLASGALDGIRDEGYNNVTGMEMNDSFRMFK